MTEKRIYSVIKNLKRFFAFVVGFVESRNSFYHNVKHADAFIHS